MGFCCCSKVSFFHFPSSNPVLKHRRDSEWQTLLRVPKEIAVAMDQHNTFSLRMLCATGSNNSQGCLFPAQPDNSYLHLEQVESGTPSSWSKCWSETLLILVRLDSHIVQCVIYCHSCSSALGHYTGEWVARLTSCAEKSTTHMHILRWTQAKQGRASLEPQKNDLIVLESYWFLVALTKHFQADANKSEKYFHTAVWKIA